MEVKIEFIDLKTFILKFFLSLSLLNHLLKSSLLFVNPLQKKVQKFLKSPLGVKPKSSQIYFIKLP